MHMCRTELSGVTIIELAGILDIVTSPRVQSEIRRWIDAGAARLLVDLSGIEQVFFSGLSTLLAIHQAMQEAGGRVVFAAPRPFFREMLKISQFDRLLEVVPERQMALETLQDTA